MKRKSVVQDHILVPKHIKLDVKKVEVLLEKYNLSLMQLPSIHNDDPAIVSLDAKPGDVIEITRINPLVGETKFYRVVINE